MDLSKLLKGINKEMSTEEIDKSLEIIKSIEYILVNRRRELRMIDRINKIKNEELTNKEVKV
jgi:hypothetical protein